LAAGLCPDPLGSLSAPPDPLAAKQGPISKGRKREGREGDRIEGERTGGEGKGGDRKGGEGKGREGKEGGNGKEEGRRGEEGGRWPPNADSWIRPCNKSATKLNVQLC